MIKIKIYENDVINSIEIKGHANYNDYGKDIVCASVSSIAIATVNALIKLNKDIDYTSKDGYLNIIINKHDEIVDKLIDNMIDLFMELETKYKNNIKIGRCRKC